MTDSPITATEVAPQAPAHAQTTPVGKTRKNRFSEVQPVLEKLFELYPYLFGKRFLPLKLGVFQELLEAHPDVFDRQSLKAALGVHARSTPYLQSVASGTSRHDLQGKVVEAVSPEHVYFAAVELFHRRQARKGISAEEAQSNHQRLRAQLIAAFDASGLSKQDYLALLPASDEIITAVLEEALSQAELDRARREALQRSYEVSGMTLQAFADSLGMDPRTVQAALHVAAN
jgi:ProP effector